MRPTRDAQRRGVDRRPGEHGPPVEEAPQVGRHLERRLIPVPGRVSIAVSAIACSGSGTRGSISTGSRGCPSRIARDDGCFVSLERGTPAQQLVKDDAERVDVGARVDRPRRIELLRRDVRDRALSDGRASDRPRSARSRGSAGASCASSMMFDGFRSRCCRPERVRVMDRLADLDHDPRPLRELERRPDASELEAVDELHDDDGRARVRPELEDRTMRRSEKSASARASRRKPSMPDASARRLRRGRLSPRRCDRAGRSLSL